METRIHAMNFVPMESKFTEMALILQQEILGYRFCPTEEELINYLKMKVTRCREICGIIPTLENIYEINPWDLPAEFNEKSIIPSKDQEWWFICPQTQNQRISRKAPCGFSWKITGKHKNIKASNGEKIGSKITLVFLDGRNSKGAKSNWVMHELHPHPDNTGFVLCWLKMKQNEKSDNQEQSIQIRGTQPNDADMAKNGDIPLISQFQYPEVSSSQMNIAQLPKNIYSDSDGFYQNRTISLAPIHEHNHQFSPNQEHLIWNISSSITANSSGICLPVSEPSNHPINFPDPFLNVDEISGTSNFIGLQADKSRNSMYSENQEQLPFAKHQVQEMHDQLTELIMKGSSSSREMSSGSHPSVIKKRKRMEPWMSPQDHDMFPNGELFDLFRLISEPEAEIRVSQYGQLGECTSWDNYWSEDQHPGRHIQQGVAPLQEERVYVKPRFSHPPGTEKIITQCASSDGVPAKAKVSKRIQLKLYSQSHTISSAEFGEAPKVGVCYNFHFRVYAI